MLGFNLYLYCNNNPVNYVDETGESAVAFLATWASTAWGLTLIDGPLPIGDIVYIAGIAIGTGLVAAGAIMVAENIDDMSITVEEEEFPNNSNDEPQNEKKIRIRGLLENQEI